MNLFFLFLFLPICVFCFSFEEIVRQVQAKQRYGKISEETKAQLLKMWGVDPEARKARLQRISKKAFLQLEENIDVTNKSRISIPQVKIEKPEENDSVDLFELNNRQGISDYLFQGDIDLTEEQLNAVERELDRNARNKRQASNFANKWTKNTVYFYFDDDMSDKKKEIFYTARRQFESQTCLKFVESKSAKNRIRVFNGSGCWSRMGMVGGEQSLSFGDGCDAGSAAHELAHALGFYHTQSRPDRDSYVTVQKDNIQEGEAGNFVKMPASDVTMYTPYEYGSFMHYAAYDFAKNSDMYTLAPKDERYGYTMGSRQITFYDYQMINKLYGCDAKCPTSTSAQCENGGYPNPLDCSKCNCPAGYGGKLCDQRPSGCGASFIASSEWKYYELHTGDEKNHQTGNDYRTCNYWISAPEGKTIQVNLVQMMDITCSDGCRYNGIEIKTENNTQMRNPLICCDEFANTFFTSSLNPTPIITYSRQKRSKFRIFYRFATAGEPTKTTMASTTTQKDEEICGDFMICNPEKDCSSSNAIYCSKTCGFCKETTAEPMTTANVRTTTTEEEEEVICEDITVCDPKKDCSYDNWFCAKTCGLCESRCDDTQYCGTSDNCKTMDPAFAKNNCAKTCGYCEGEAKTTTVSTTTTEKEEIICGDFIDGCGEQDCSSAFAQFYCAKSCGICSSL